MRKRFLNCTFVRLEAENKADSVLVNAYEKSGAEMRSERGFMSRVGGDQFISLGSKTLIMQEFLPRTQCCRPVPVACYATDNSPLELPRNFEVRHSG